MTNPEPPDIEIARYGLRTFEINDGELASMAIVGSHWQGGTCEAKCFRNSMQYGFVSDITNPRHKSPDEGCTCGIYATVTLQSLQEQYMAATKLVTVIAAEGKTIIGDRGMRTSAARIVAYWSPSRRIRKVCKKQCVGAKHFKDLDEMLVAYNLPRDNPPPPSTLVFYVPLMQADVIARSPFAWILVDVQPGTYTAVKLIDATCPIAPVTISSPGAQVIATLTHTK